MIVQCIRMDGSDISITRADFYISACRRLVPPTEGILEFKRILISYDLHIEMD